MKEKRMRVLFADDQIPSSIDSENDICKQELRKTLSDKLPDFDSAYQADYKWFTELIRHLSVDMGFTLTTARSLSKAMELAQKRDEYDVALIDLSWMGDPGLPPGEKKNSGLRVLRAIADGNKVSGRYKPAIAFSQNYKEDPALFAEVLETEALPIPKDYTSIGHRSVGAAIKLMGLKMEVGKSSVRKKWDQASIGEIVASLSLAQIWTVILTIVSALAAVATAAFWFGQTIPLRAKAASAISFPVPKPLDLQPSQSPSGSASFRAALHDLHSDDGIH
jgi:CheY-like chemotaxis protein